MNDFIPANQTTQLSKTQDRSESTLAGPERAAALLLSLGLDHGGKIWEQLDEMEIKEVSAAMVKLGYVDPAELELVLTEFVETLSVNGALTGSIENTERLLAKYLPSEQVTAVMAEIRGPAGRTMWEKLSNVQENVLASYLKNEYPQTIAVVLSQIGPDHAARVLSILPEELALEVIDRMLRIDLVQRDVLEKVEQTLRTEFMSNLTDSNKRDSHEIMADIFNSFDRQTEARFMSALDEDNRESAERIKALMFTFEDLMKLDASGCQALLQNVEKDQLTIALKGASEEIKEFFFSNMSGRAAKLLQDDMDALGPVRLSEVDVAQSVLVVAAKDLAAKGEIILSSGGDEELVY